MNRDWPHCCQALAGLELKNACWQLDYDPYNNMANSAALSCFIFVPLDGTSSAFHHIYTKLSWFVLILLRIVSFPSIFVSQNSWTYRAHFYSLGPLLLTSRTDLWGSRLCLHLTLCDLITINPLSWVPFQLRDLPMQDQLSRFRLWKGRLRCHILQSCILQDKISMVKRLKCCLLLARRIEKMSPPNFRYTARKIVTAHCSAWIPPREVSGVDSILSIFSESASRVLALLQWSSISSGPSFQLLSPSGLPALICTFGFLLSTI